MTLIFFMCLKNLYCVKCSFNKIWDSSYSSLCLHQSALKVGVCPTIGSRYLDSAWESLQNKFSKILISSWTITFSSNNIPILVVHGTHDFKCQWRTKVLAIQTLAVIRWKISRIITIPDSLKIAFHVLTAATDYFPLDCSGSKYFLSNPIMILLGDSALTLILSCPIWDDRQIKTQEKSMTHHLFGKFQFSSQSQRGLVCDCTHIHQWKWCPRNCLLPHD